jgi:hypothetical protein
MTTLTSHKTLKIIFSLALLSGLLPFSGAPATGAQGTGGRLYPQTGKTLAPEFVAYYDANGGVPQFGYPLTDAEIEGGFKVQYLERARIEYHPEHRGTPHEVQLGLLGTIVTEGRRFEPARGAAPHDGVLFPETNHTLSGAFYRYWRERGGLAIFGYPISEPFTEGGYLVQYFQRNRFELHPENVGTPYEVLLGLLGRDLLNQRVQVRETSVSIPTYDYERAYTSPPSDASVPYPRLDFSRVGSPQPRTYRLIVMENRYLRLSIMPELGGRLYEAVFKPTGHNELYKNPVIKPSTFGARGWWLAAGGTEWAAPTDEHGLMEHLPWNASVTRLGNGGATVSMTQTDRLTGMKVTGTVTLNPEEGAYKLGASMENGTATAQRGQLWTNAMLAPGGTNRVPPSSRWTLPHPELIVHSTSDPDLPPERSRVGWPQHAGRDLATMSTWKGWLGGFVPPDTRRGLFAALYNPEADEGMVKTFAVDMTGLKIFGFGPGFDPRIYTDDNSNYAELWGGVTPTFWDNALFQPGTSLGWSEQWQPVARLGGVSLAGAWGTIGWSGTSVSIQPVRRIEGASLVVRAPGGALRTTLPFSASPDRPATLPLSGAVGEFEVLGPDGKSLLRGAPAAR